MKGKTHGSSYSLCRWLAGLALAAVSLTSHARGDIGKWADWEWQSQTGSSAKAGPMTPSGSPTTFTPGADGGEASGSKKAPWGRGSVDWRSKIKAADMSRSLIRPPAQAAITLVGSYAIKQLLDEMCVRVMGGVLKEGALWDECVPGTGSKAPTSDGFTYNYAGSNAGNFPTAMAACTHYAAKEQASAPGYTVTVAGVKRIGGGSAYTHCSLTYKQGNNAPATVDRQITASAGCTAGLFIYPDGSCAATPPPPQWQSADVDNIEQMTTDKVRAKCQTDPVTCEGLFKDATSGGGTVAADDPTIESVTQPTPECTNTKRTRSDGSYTISTVCREETLTKSPTQPGTVERTSKEVTTEQDHASDGTPDGPPRTETEETTNDERSKCEVSPNSLECNAEFDTPVGEVPKSTVNVAFSVEDLGWGSGSCPASPMWTDRLGTHTLNMGPICDIISSVVKPLVLAMAALMALAIAVPRESV